MSDAEREQMVNDVMFDAGWDLKFKYDRASYLTAFAYDAYRKMVYAGISPAEALHALDCVNELPC